MERGEESKDREVMKREMYRVGEIEEERSGDVNWDVNEH